MAGEIHSRRLAADIVVEDSHVRGWAFSAIVQNNSYQSKKRIERTPRKLRLQAQKLTLLYLFSSRFLGIGRPWFISSQYSPIPQLEPSTFGLTP
jgi:hypothetical protein